MPGPKMPGEVEGREDTDTVAARGGVEIQLDVVDLNPAANAARADDDDMFNSPAAIAIRRERLRAMGLTPPSGDGCLLSCLKGYTSPRGVAAAYAAATLALFPLLSYIATWPDLSLIHI